MWGMKNKGGLLQGGVCGLEGEEDPREDESGEGLRLRGCFPF